MTKYAEKFRSFSLLGIMNISRGLEAIDKVKTSNELLDELKESELGEVSPYLFEIYQSPSRREICFVCGSARSEWILTQKFLYKEHYSFNAAVEQLELDIKKNLKEASEFYREIYG